MMLILGVITLAAGTFAFRWAGPALREHVHFSPRAVRLLETGAIVLIAGLVAVTVLPLGTSDLGLAMPLGVAVAGLLAWRGQSTLVVVLAAAATTATLRLLGVA
ncbi:AzlD domain-containing protein [Nocardia callitridis]|uniref:Branched-chain amino acid transporter n=1 Tax=Nocardia callitridis TaxID=648753 RepID=A0ABP9L3Z3_9NOCA